jgi:carbonic anhydrase
LDRLLAGNKRFVADQMTLAHKGSARRSEVAKGQHPIAIVVSCSDSRVPVEQVFDQGNGDLFVVRTAGNVVDAVALGSIEYAADHLHVPLIVVLGHERCGAVTAAVGTDAPPGHILAVVENIQQHLKGTKPLPGDAVEQAVQINARGVAQDIITSKPILAGLVRSEDVVVVAARYDLDSGEVTLLP